MKKPNKTKPAPKPKLDEFHYFEVMDRVEVIRDNWDRFIMGHPVLAPNIELFRACHKVDEALAGVSSEIARLNFPRPPKS